MTVNDDPFVTYDAAYVLGALSPDERQDFELHLQQCARCSAAVRELAGMPGLLARVDPPPQANGFAPEPPDLSPPPDLLTDVLRQVRRGRRIRNAVTTISAVVAVAACVALGVVLSVPTSVAPGSPTQPPPIAMQALGQFPVQADARLASQEWGTQVDMSCSYTGGHADGDDYVLVAIGRDGTVTQLATWRALPANTARIVVGTPLHPADIQSLEIRTATGRPLLRLPL